MSYLLFLDESGHDHRHLPYEIHGGITLHDRHLWNFSQAIDEMQLAWFGMRLVDAGKEVKGSHLLDKDRFKWARQTPELPRADIAKYAGEFIQANTTPCHYHFQAYGRASIELAHSIFALLQQYDGKIFAGAISRGILPPAAGERSAGIPQDRQLLRKDLVFLLERFYYFLEEQNETGLIVMDASEKTLQRNLARRIEAYFTNTAKGRERARRIVPTPMFIESDMNYPVQVADLCIYCINWGFRIPSRGMDSPVREDIARRFAPAISTLQYRGVVVNDNAGAATTFGVFFVPDPYTSRTPQV